MIRGLVIGKFMPVHLGHVALINFATQHCSEVIVSMSYKPDDPIDPQIRLAWLRAIFRDSTRVKIASLPDDFDDDRLPLPHRTSVWADVMREKYPPIDVVVSSESYGEPFAKNLHARNVTFDPMREQVPVSATAIRAHPFRNWDFIPEVVKPFFVKRICMYGPESTGKTTLAINMARHYNTAVVPEVAREMLTSNNFDVDMIRKIGEAQARRTFEKTMTANKLLICDTDLITTQIYSRHYLKEIPDVLRLFEQQLQYHHYFLFDIDVPWVPDGLRDLGDRREEMLQIFRQELEKRKIPYTFVQGTFPERASRVRSVLDQILSQG